MENPIKMDDLGGFPPYFWKHPSVVCNVCNFHVIVEGLGPLIIESLSYLSLTSWPKFGVEPGRYIFQESKSLNI